MKQIMIDALGGAVLNLTTIKGNLIIGNITYLYKKFHINYWMSKPDELEITDNLQIIEKWDEYYPKVYEAIKPILETITEKIER